MKFKSLKVVLMAASLLSANISLAEKIPETADQKEARIEKQLNFMFQEALKAAAVELDTNKKVYPFAFVIKKDGNVGYFTATGENKDLSVNEQSARIRRMLKDLAITGQIDASTFVMYAGVTQGDKKEQGLVLEVEHRVGLSLLRFLPVVEGTGDQEGKLVLETGRMQSSVKQRNIFVDSIVKQK